MASQRVYRPRWVHALACLCVGSVCVCVLVASASAAHVPPAFFALTNIAISGLYLARGRARAAAPPITQAGGAWSRHQVFADAMCLVRVVCLFCWCAQARCGAACARVSVLPLGWLPCWVPSRFVTFHVRGCRCSFSVHGGLSKGVMVGLVGGAGPAVRSLALSLFPLPALPRPPLSPYDVLY